MPAGIGSPNASVGLGFKEVRGNKYLKLRRSQDNGNAYNYTVRESGVIYDDVTGNPTEYRADGDYNLYQNNVELTCKQYDYNFNGRRLVESKTEADVNMNIFYKDSVFKAFPTNYLAMRYSDEEGQT